MVAIRRESFAATHLSTRRLRSNSDSAPQDVSVLSPAEANTVVPQAPVYKIVLTGGPCGGKTTALARLMPYLRERGFEVFASPEAFSVLVSNGMPFSYLGAVEGMGGVVQDTVMDLQIGIEDGFERVLRARGKPAVLLCDRGLMDGAAYMSPEEWEKFMRKRGVSCASELREGRYHAVFHLVTAAEGAERYYTLENNEVRTETPAEARALDHGARRAWLGHPRLKIFDNSTDFETKLQRIVEETARLVGLPTDLAKHTTKFQLKNASALESFPDDVAYQVVDVEKIYLYEEDKSTEYGDDADQSSEYSFIRKRVTLSSNGTPAGSVYGQTIVQKTRGNNGNNSNDDGRGQTIETKRIITQREYNSLITRRDRSRHVIQQKRIAFIWNLQSFNIHIYTEPVDNICILHAQTARKSVKMSAVSEEEHNGNDGSSNGNVETMDDVDLPPFLDVVRRINDTEEDETKFGAYGISLKRNE